MDAPFALQGLLDGCKSIRKNGLPQLHANIELYPKHKTVARPFHGSRVVSESAKGAYLNRPLSPHLPLKKPQLSATYSISHRIFGAGVACAILVLPLSVKFSTLFGV